MRVTVSVPGTLGEWVQGWIGEAGEALVSCVIEKCGQVILEQGAGKADLPAKAIAALRFGKEQRGISLEGWGIALHNPLPVAMGLASSTVDVCGVLAGVAEVSGAPFDEETLFSLCCRVEPSDGVMFSGLALVDHLGGRLLERLPSPPPLWLAAVLPERTLDTEAYRRDPLFVGTIHRFGTEHREAYRVFRRGLLDGDVRLIGAGAQESARIQQLLLPREEWPLLLACRRECGGDGVVVAHSGTASAVLFGSEAEARRGEAWLCSRWDGGKVRVFPVRGGGITVDRDLQV